MIQSTATLNPTYFNTKFDNYFDFWQRRIHNNVKDTKPSPVIKVWFEVGRIGRWRPNPYFQEIDDDIVYLMDSTLHTLGDFRRFIWTPWGGRIERKSSVLRQFAPHCNLSPFERCEIPPPQKKKVISYCEYPSKKTLSNVLLGRMTWMFSMS